LRLILIFDWTSLHPDYPLHISLNLCLLLDVFDPGPLWARVLLVYDFDFRHITVLISLRA
jgi:hypothetical protein